MSKHQLDLFHVQKAYETANRPISNEELYEKVATLAGIPRSELNAKSKIGSDGTPRSKIKRTIRWHQQTMKGMGLLEKIEGERGIWKLSNQNKSGLNEIIGDTKLLAYSTNLGFAVWSNSNSAFRDMNEPIHLCVTSPPYPLRVQRGYGNVAEAQWVDFMTEALEPIVKNLVPGGSIVLNISNDIFESKKPSRSLYMERMIIALHDRLGLSLMDRWPWINTSKPPGPTYWASITRQQLCTAWEPVLWFSNDPVNVRSNNNRVLIPHTEAHSKLIESGGEKRDVSYGDGAYTLRSGKSFSRKTKGKIPKNVIQRGHRCADSQEARRVAKRLGLPAHPAMFPTAIAEFAIEFLTEEGDLVVDPFSGTNKTGLASERLNRRWFACDIILQFLRTQAELFSSMPGFWINPELRAMDAI